MSERGLVIVALSGGVDSAVAALLLREAGYRVECLHMTNWHDDGYCDAAADFQDARSVCRDLGLPLHRVDFSREYRAQVFEHFLEEHRRGRTPNPDVLCNREIKFGVMREYARRLGAQALATGHYARLERRADGIALLKARDASKDQSYFLCAVAQRDLEGVLFPLGELEKREVRRLARQARLPVADKRDSTGICFIGERPFAEFLSRYVPAEPGPIRASDGRVLGTHRGLACYTLGQRQGLGIGGVAERPEAPWYVAAKIPETNELIVVQGHDHPLLFRRSLIATDPHWIGRAPGGLDAGAAVPCAAKIRYRQPDQACTIRRVGEREIEVRFERPQRLPTPGQYAVFYDGERCLGGAVIDRTEDPAAALPGAA
ncbi:MAG TPA: tRNA 2-thiouridine(34) synthase MnmA [Gammaproteobacteria bacterium]